MTTSLVNGMTALHRSRDGTVTVLLHSRDRRIIGMHAKCFCGRSFGEHHRLSLQICRGFQEDDS